MAITTQQATRTLLNNVMTGVGKVICGVDLNETVISPEMCTFEMVGYEDDTKKTIRENRYRFRVIVVALPMESEDR